MTPYALHLQHHAQLARLHGFTHLAAALERMLIAEIKRTHTT